MVIDDGSTDGTAKFASTSATVLKLPNNKGKSEALNEGFRYVREQGFDAVITMDGDGRHNPMIFLSLFQLMGERGFLF